MNAYKVKYKIKNGGYKPEDWVTSGGYYDTEGHLVVYASNPENARTLASSLINAINSTKIYKPVLIMKGV